MSPSRLGVILLLALLVAGLSWRYWPRAIEPWSPTEVAILQSLSLDALPPLPEAKSNAVADDPRAVALGAQLFFDTRLSANGDISCATCHQPERRFTDGLEKGQAIGMSRRNTPSLVGVAYSPWLYWDGRRDSLWAQALSPLEDSNEQGTDRRQVTNLIAKDTSYRTAYEVLFGALPDLNVDDSSNVNRVFANVGKAIAAFERTLLPTASRFEQYISAVVAGDEQRQQTLFSDDEVHGLKLFVGDAACTQCHNGPLLTNNEFHNTGVISFPGELPDKGRIDGIDIVMLDEFNCSGEYSDDSERHCSELQFARHGIELLGAMRTPSLRNLEDTAPYMHKGQLKTLADVLQHYNDAPDAMIGHNEAKPLGLSASQLHQLEAFLLTLSSPPGGTAL